MTKVSKDKNTEPAATARQRSKSPARTTLAKSPEAPRGRGRPRSPSRSPARTPQRGSRDTNSMQPTVQSSRKSETATEEASPSRTTRRSKVVNSIESPSSKASSATSEMVVVRSQRKMTERTESETPVRQSVRIAAVRSLQSTSSVLTERKVASRSDVTRSNAVDEVDAKLGKKSAKFPWQLVMRGSISVIAVTAMCSFLLCAVMACNLTSCDLMKLPSCSHSLSLYVDPEAALMFAGWMLLQLLLASMPVGPLRLGQTLPGGTRLQYRCNGLFCLVVTGLLLAAAYYVKLPVFAMVSGHFVQLAVTGLLAAFVVGFVGYIRARHLPPDQLATSSTTGCGVCNLISGCQLNPRLCSIDVKMFAAVNVASLGWFVLAAVTVVRAYELETPLNTAFWMTAAFQFIYISSVFICQPWLVNSLLMNSDGFGLSSAIYTFAVFPVFHSMQLRYLLLNPQPISHTTAVASATIFLVGFVVNRWAVYIKDKFRQNQHDPQFSAYKTVATVSGKPLLASGLWGWCRHPNYLGCIVMSIAWSIPCGFDCPLTYAYPVLVLLLLACRAARDAKVCEAKHGAVPWSQYCRLVRSRLIPFVY